MENQEKIASGNKLQKQGWIRKIFDFNNLLMEQKYKFQIKLSNSIYYGESIISNSIIAQTIPESGEIDSIKCNPQLHTLNINYKYLKNYIIINQ